jgi:hypothetical protein
LDGKWDQEFAAIANKCPEFTFLCGSTSRKMDGQKNMFGDKLGTIGGSGEGDHEGRPYEKHCPVGAIPCGRPLEARTNSPQMI